MTAPRCDCRVPFGCYRCNPGGTRFMWAVLGALLLYFVFAAVRSS